MTKRDYYEVLGVPRTATKEQIRSAYRKLARKYHPDASKEAGATGKFKEATQAYEVLSDPQKRKTYDQFGHAGPGGAGGPGAPGGWPGGGPGGAGRGGRVNIEDIFGRGADSPFMGMGLDDIMDALGGGRRRKPAKRQGEDVEYEIALDFLQAIRGMTATLRIQREESPETLEVKIPPGVKDGARIRLRGQGQPGRGEPGDLYIKVSVRPHEYFRREGDDIYIDVPISVSEACLGARVDVPTIDGMTTVTIPPCMSSSRRLRLRGKGVAAGDGQRGDQYIEVRIVLPAALSPKAQELMEELSRAAPYDARKDSPWR
ncbi:MAG: J domain-containing protein [Planctomycetota bacterium]